MAIRKLNETIFLDRRRLSVFLLVLLLLSVAISSLNGNAKHFSTNSLILNVTMVVFIYTTVISTMRLLGGNPNKFEMFVIPGFAYIIFLFALQIFHNRRPQTSDPVNTSDPVSSITSQSSDVNTQIDKLSDEISNTSAGSYIVNGSGNQAISGIILSIILVVFFLSLAIILIALLLQREIEEPDFHLTKESEYRMDLPERNLDLVQLYLDISDILERLRGKAPHWFSPTKFSQHIKIHPGAPVASYFEILTTMYEYARFSKREISVEDLMEAEELVSQIKTWSTGQLKEILEYE